MRNVQCYITLWLVTLLVCLSMACVPQEAEQTQTIVEQSKPKAAIFQIGPLAISPTPIVAGDTITVTANVTNVGDEAGMYEAALSLDGQVTDIANINISAGESSIAEFKLNNLAAGKHDIAIGESILSIGVLPSPTKIAFTSYFGDWEVCTVNSDGTNIERTTKNGALDIHPTWSSDGTRIAFQSTREWHSQGSIYVMDSDGKNVQCLTPEPNICRFPAWSPDGKKIAYCVMKMFGGGPPGTMGGGEVRPDAIFVMNPDGSGKKRITNGWGPSWFPDSKRIAFMSSSAGIWEIHSIDIYGSKLRRHHTLYGAGVNYGLPLPSSEFPVLAVSPDGSLIALEYYSYSPGGSKDIYVLKLDTGDLRNLTRKCDGRCYSPAWSPDSKQIAFTVEENDDISIYVMNADGSNLKKLIENGYQPAWQR